jgi:polypeptide N-acetylgalactosaminyltransferase
VDEKVLEALRSRHLEKGQGQYGQAVSLRPNERRRADALFSVWGYNAVSSQKVSVHRSVPDRRSDACKESVFSDGGLNVSVVIVFNNEGWSTLLRTVWSVLHSTPEELLHEILLLDDFSDRAHLRRPLTKYIKVNFPDKVKMRRLDSRQGLIRARYE